MRDAEIFSDVPTGSDRDEILKRTRKTKAKYIRSSDENTESEDERVVKVPQFPKFPGRNSTKNIETHEKKKGNGVASLKQSEENVSMRETFSTSSSKFEKGGKMRESKIGNKLVSVVKKVANNVPSTLKSDSELSGGCHEIFSEDEEFRSLYRKESSATEKELFHSSSVQSLENAETKFRHLDKFLDAPSSSLRNGK